MTLTDILIFQRGFDLAQIFPENWPKIEIGKWSITNIDYLEFSWGKIKETKLFFARVAPFFIRYNTPCSCRITRQGNQLSFWVEYIGPKICPGCGQILLIKCASEQDRDWLDIFGEV